MTTSWIIATIAATAIRHSKRMAMTIENSSRNTSRAITALRVICSPHDDDTAATLTSAASTPAASANASCNDTRTSAGTSSICTLTMSPCADSRSSTLASLPSIPWASRIDRGVGHGELAGGDVEGHAALEVDAEVDARESPATPR